MEAGRSLMERPVRGESKKLSSLVEAAGIDTGEEEISYKVDSSRTQM